MSKTPVSTSGEVIVAVASHFSNVPSIATDAFTWNLIELSSFVILMTGTPAGACARLTDGSTAEAKRHRATNRMKFLGWRQNFTRLARLSCWGTKSHCQKLQAVALGRERWRPFT